MITAEMRRIIEENTIALVATVAPDGTPRVSPKATVVIVDPTHIAFTDLRSPGTARNIKHQPAVEMNFIDIFRRKACRLRGTAAYHARDSETFARMLAQFQKWEDLKSRMRGVFLVEINHAELIRSPAYDAGAKEGELKAHWLQYFTKLNAG